MNAFTEPLDLIWDLCPDGFIAALVVAAVAPALGLRLFLHRRPLLALALPPVANLGPLILLAWPALEIAAFGSWNSAVFALASQGLGLVLCREEGRGAPPSRGPVALFLVAGALAILLQQQIGEFAAAGALGTGQILLLSPEGRTRCILCALPLVLFLWFSARRATLAALDPEEARLQSISPARQRLLDLSLPAFGIALFVPTIGPEALMAPLLLPIALLLSAAPSNRSLLPLATAASLLGTFAAFFVSVRFDWPFAPAQILSLTSVSLLLAAAAHLWSSAQRLHRHPESSAKTP